MKNLFDNDKIKKNNFFLKEIKKIHQLHKKKCKKYDLLIGNFAKKKIVDIGIRLNPNTDEYIALLKGDGSVFRLKSTDSNNFALYFSRSVIPYNRFDLGVKYYKHKGVYAFRRNQLLEFTKLPILKLEKSEKIECIRYLEHGKKIKMVETLVQGIEIDTPEDLIKARSKWNEDNIKGYKQFIRSDHNETFKDITEAYGISYRKFDALSKFSLPLDMGVHVVELSVNKATPSFVMLRIPDTTTLSGST